MARGTSRPTRVDADIAATAASVAPNEGRTITEQINYGRESACRSIGQGRSPPGGSLRSQSAMPKSPRSRHEIERPPTL